MLTRACLFSKDKEIIELCQCLNDFKIRFSFFDSLQNFCAPEDVKKVSFVFLDAELLDYDTASPKPDSLISQFQKTPIIIISRLSSVYMGIEYYRRGFNGFVEFPCSCSFLYRRIQKVLQHYSLQKTSLHNNNDQKVPNLENEKSENDLYLMANSFDSFLGESDIVKQMKKNLVRYAETEFPIFLYGETGTGKNLLASAIWKHSARKNKQFLWENLGAIPAGLASSTLFGTTAGSYTDARNYPGLFEAAEHGTVFLDEIECASLDVQKGLLCISENMECKRIGAHKTYKPDVRIITACNVNLRQLVKEKKFREDLFYRLTWLPVRVPTLRERLSDIPLLVDSILKKIGKGISDNAIQRLMSYTWPGNVRELFTCIRRAAVLCDGSKIELSDIRCDLDNNYNPSPEFDNDF